MANNTIPQLPETLSVNDNTLVPIDSGAQTFKSKLSTLKSFIVSDVVDNVDNTITPLLDRFKEMLSVMLSTNFTGETLNSQFPNTFISGAYSPSLNTTVMISSTSGNGALANLRIARNNQSLQGNNFLMDTFVTAKNWIAGEWSSELGLFAFVSSTTGDNSQVITSPSGSVWTVRNSSAAVAWRGLKWGSGAGRFVAVGPNSVMFSSNGTTWTSGTSPENNQWEKITWSEPLGLFVMVSGNGANRIASSPDGATWTLRSNIQYPFNSVEWSDELGMFIATSNGDGMAYSYDGISWQALDYNDLGIGTSTYSVIKWYKKAQAFLLFDQGAVCISRNGLNWTRYSINTSRTPGAIYAAVETKRGLILVRTGTDTNGGAPLFSLAVDELGLNI